MGVEFIVFLAVYSGCALIEGVTLGKMITGTRYRVLLWVISMLIGSNISYIVEAAFGYKYFVKDVQKSAYNIIQFVTGPIGDLLFGEAHWVLAFYYYKVAKNVPRIADGMKD